MLVDINQKIYQKNDAQVSIFDMGFYFGLGLYETILIEEGVPIAYEQHLMRLKKSINYFESSLKNIGASQHTNIFNTEDFFKHLPQRIQNLKEAYFKQYHEIVNFKLRVMLTPHNYLHSNKGSEILFLHKNQLKPTYQLFTSDMYKTQHSENPNYVKATSNIISILSYKQAQEANYDEAILLNKNYQITEGSFSNLFFIKENKVYTPSLQDNLLAGITRSLILEILNQNNIAYEEVSLPIESIYDWDAIFLTSSTRGIKTISKIGFHSEVLNYLKSKIHVNINQAINFTPNKLLTKIIKLYNKYKINYIEESKVKWA